MAEIVWSGRPLRALHLELLDAGACFGRDPGLWFPRGRPARNREGVERQTAYARGACAGCPVVAPCLEYALRAGCEYGVWGGRTEDERRGLALTGLGLSPAGVAA